MPNLLLVAFHFPPAAFSSGVQRVLSMAETLPKHGWNVTVLTAHERAYPPGPAPEPIPDGVEVVRAQAWDTVRHFSFKRRYPAWLAEPDRWMSWYPDAVRVGRSVVRQKNIDAVLSTYPLATAHRIANAVTHGGRVPWAADFRDPMSDESFPPPGRKRDLQINIEQQAGQHCSLGLVTSPTLLARYQAKFPAADKWQLILNGFREDAFINLERSARAEGPFILLHSGLIYPTERDPTALFQALARLKAAGTISKDTFQLRLRAPGHRDWLGEQLNLYGITDIVEVPPAIQYREALAEMLQVDGLLIMQSSSFNSQIPAKAYEYLRAQRPILALTDPAGDTATILRDVPCARVTPLDQTEQIEAALIEFMRTIPQLEQQALPLKDLQAFSRGGQAAKLAGHLQQMLIKTKQAS